VIILLCSVSLVSCGTSPLSGMSHGLSRAATDIANGTRGSKASRPSRPSLKVSDSINPTLRESLSCGEEYKLFDHREQLLSYVETIQGPYSKSPRLVFGGCGKSTITLRSAASNRKFEFDEYVGVFGQAAAVVVVCDRFRIKFPEKVGKPHIIRGFNPDGKCIYYLEWYRDTERRPSKNLPAESKQKGKDAMPPSNQPLDT
jgi:hypothetical protein